MITTPTQTLSKTSIERVREVEAAAETPAEIRAALLWRRWARWARRFDSCPSSAAYDRNELTSWSLLRAHLDEHDLTDTAFDPAD